MTDSTTGTPRTRPRPRTSDLIGTGILGFLGLVAVLMGVGYGFIGDDGQIGPGFLPVLTGGFILLASLAEIGRLLLGPRGQGAAGLGSVAEVLSAEATGAQGSAEDEATLDTFGRTAKQRRLTVPLIFAVTLAALLLTQVVGMLIALTAMMLTLLLLVERKPLVPSVLASLAVLGIAYLIFVQLLGVPLPQGLLGIL